MWRNMAIVLTAGKFWASGPRTLRSELADLVVDYEVERYDEDGRQHHSKCEKSVCTLRPIDGPGAHENQVEADETKSIDECGEDPL